MDNVTLAFLGMWETIAILAVVLILFGAKKLPELAKGLGKGIREFKKASTDVQGEFQRNWDETEHEQRRQLREAEERDRPQKADDEDKKDSVTVESTSDSESSKT